MRSIIATIIKNNIEQNIILKNNVIIVYNIFIFMPGNYNKKIYYQKHIIYIWVQGYRSIFVIYIYMSKQRTRKHYHHSFIYIINYSDTDRNKSPN